MKIDPRTLAFCAVFGFLYIFALEWVWHGVLMQAVYEATAELWRTKEGMQALFPFAILGQMIFSIVTASIFTQGYKGSGPEEGVRFGLYFGALLTAMHLACYAYMPIPLFVILSWMAADFLKMIGLGVIFVHVHKKF